MEPKYKKVLLKISGEALAGEKKTGLDEEMLQQVAEQVKAIKDMGVQVAVVVGGGNFWRGRTSQSMDRATADYMGMLATVINSLALQDAFERNGIPARVQTAIEDERGRRALYKKKSYFRDEQGISRYFRRRNRKSVLLDRYDSSSSRS